jgi:threonine dehydrogenase-like Zn-dependent dehydrogenase
VSGGPAAGPPLQARALVFTAPGQVVLRSETLRRRKGQVRVDAELMAISHGTEMLIYRGQLPEDLEADTALKSLSGPLAYPIKYGYSNVGQREDGRRVFAFYPHQDRFYLEPDQTVCLPDSLSSGDAVFLANMETALGIVHDLSLRLGECVLVIGQGVVGLLVSELLLRSGAGQVLALERYALRREAASALGCRVLDPEDRDLRERIFEFTGGRGADAAVNTSGSEEGLQLAVDCLAFGATVVEASWYGSRPVTLTLGSAFHRRRLVVKSSQVSRLDPVLSGRWDKPRRLALALNLLEEVRPARYISRRIKLAEGAEAFALLDKAPETLIQLVLEP